MGPSTSCRPTSSRFRRSFTPTYALLLASDGLAARVRSLSADFERFMPWRTTDGTQVASNGTPEMPTLIEGEFEHRRLLDLLRDFTVFGKPAWGSSRSSLDTTVPRGEVGDGTNRARHAACQCGSGRPCRLRPESSPIFAVDSLRLLGAHRARRRPGGCRRRPSSPRASVTTGCGRSWASRSGTRSLSPSGRASSRG